MEEHLKNLARARKAIHNVDEELMRLKVLADEMLAESIVGHQMERMRQQHTLLSQQIGISETLLRVDAIEQFEVTGNKKFPGVEIKINTLLQYDEQAAIDWAAKANPLLLKLERRGFEKVARIMPLEFVTKLESPAAYIASDLSQWDHEESNVVQLERRED